MIQKARSSSSRSFLREIEDALVLIENEKDRNYFLDQMREVFCKRRDPFITLTGERALKTELLAYLKQKGLVQTANVWARAIPMDRKEIDELLLILQTRLKENGIQGILELHLQDREINSPHFQFVGLECARAESIIAHTLVEFSYESSVESALSKKDFMPYFKENSKARVQDLNTALDYYAKKKEGIVKKEDVAKPYDDDIWELLEELEEKIKKANGLLRTFEEREVRLKNMQTRLSEYRMYLRSKSNHYKKLRRKMRRRR